MAPGNGGSGPASVDENQVRLGESLVQVLARVALWTAVAVVTAGTLICVGTIVTRAMGYTPLFAPYPYNWPQQAIGLLGKLVVAWLGIAVVAQYIGSARRGG